MYNEQTPWLLFDNSIEINTRNIMRRWSLDNGKIRLKDPAHNVHYEMDLQADDKNYQQQMKDRERNL